MKSPPPAVDVGKPEGAKARPVRLFLSYASEDEDITAAVSDSLETLTQFSYGNIRAIHDKTSFDVGAPVPLIQEISDKLFDSDYLIIIYTGALKKSFGWTGTELGIFWGFIRADIRERGSSRRQIVVIYFDEKPPVDWGGLAIHLELSAFDLRFPKEEFKRKVKGEIQSGHHQYDSLINTMENIGLAADAGLPKESGADSQPRREWADHLVKRSAKISDDIVPDLMEQLHESFSKRVRKTSIEQSLIEFRIPKAFDSTGDNASLPDETVLAGHGEVFSLFGVGGEGAAMTWGAFKAGFKNSSEAAWIIASIERSAISAVSPDMARDDEQIIRSPRTDSIYRIIITRRFEFFDGSATLHMYFIPALRFAFLEKSDTAITLGFINVAVKYREIFINPASDLSIRDYYRKSPFDDLKTKVCRSIRELQIIEDESHILELDERPSIVAYFGGSEEESKAVGEMYERYTQLRKRLFSASHGVQRLTSAAEDGQKESARSEWVDALSKFVSLTEEINSVVLNKAIDNLRSHLFAGDK